MKKENTVKSLIREFHFKGMNLADPGMHLSPADVRDYYSAHFPDLTGAAVKGPKVEGSKEIWNFEGKVGTKG